jgi:patatin-like phospholipase/acyl hydrolase
MFAGTSAGSIIATGLAVPEKDDANEPEFWALDIISIFEELVVKVFVPND